MKYLFCILLLFCGTVYASETLCVDNNSGGYIHILPGPKRTVIGTSVTGAVLMGRASRDGPLIAVIWGDGVTTYYPSAAFKKCDL